MGPKECAELYALLYRSFDFIDNNELMNRTLYNEVLSKTILTDQLISIGGLARKYYNKFVSILGYNELCQEIESDPQMEPLSYECLKESLLVQTMQKDFTIM